MQRGGKCVYFGPIGKDSSDLMGYLTAINPEYALPSERNPADHILDVWLACLLSSYEECNIICKRILFIPPKKTEMPVGWLCIAL